MKKIERLISILFTMAILGGGAFRMLKNSVKLWVLIAILLIITSLFGVIASVYGNVPDHLLRIQEAGNNGDTGIALAESVTDETDTSSGTLSDPQSFFISTTDPATLNPPDSNSLFSKIDSFLDANRSVFLFFYADWCHFCKEQKPVIDDLEQEYSGKVAFVRINVDEKAQYCEVFEVTGYPTLILITGKIDGKYESEKLSGYTSKEKLTEVINRDTSRSDQVNLIGTSRAIKFEGTVSDQETQHSSDQIAINFCDSSQTVSRSELFSSYSDDVENFTVTQSTSYLEIMDYNCVGYDVYVNGVFQFTEGGDGYCGLNIPCAQDVTIELRKNGHSISKTRYVDCGVSYYWEITENWCAPSDVTVSDVKILRGEFVNKSFQPLETVDVVGLGDVFIIEVNVTNTGNETMNLYNLYYWELSPSNRVEIIGNASTCLTYIPLQSNKSASLLPFCLSQGFKAKETGWVTMNITVKDWNDQPVCEHTFDFEIVGGQCMDINAPGYYALTADIINSSARWCINITASNVIFEGNGHTVDGVDASNTCGVWVGTHTALRNVTIRNVTVTDWGYCGIIFNGVEEGRIERCTAASNDYGIVLFSSANNTAIDNAASSNTDGIYSFFSDNNTILHNFVTLNYGGIGFSYSSNNSVLNNNASGNYLGIDLYQNSNKNTIAGNIVEYNLHHGLFLDSDSTSNIINQNTICSNNQIGGTYQDIHNEATNSGDDNTCNTTYNWNDYGGTACTYLCGIAVENCSCSTCSECIDKLNSAACSVVILRKDILNSTGTCINNPENFTHKIFNCQGYLIDGQDLSNSYGIYLNNKSGNIIKNCVITDFTDGIRLEFSSNNTITNNTATSNGWYGLVLWSSSNNTVNNNTAHSNGQGISLQWYSSNNTVLNNTFKENEGSDLDFLFDLYGNPSIQCNNIIQDNIGSGNRSIKYFNHAVNLQNEVLSELILCNADNSNINNISIKGSEAKKNNKLGVYFTDLSNFTNINSSNNIRGIYLESSTRNTLINNILNYNGDDGLLLIHSSSNNLTNNTANSNDDSGIYLYFSSNNSVVNNTANSNTDSGIYLYSYSSNNSVIKNAANSNGNFGIYLYFYSSNNSLNNNTVTSNNRGISLYECSNNSITNNNVSSNVYGVRLYSHTNFNYIMSNFISNNNHGITITSSDEPNFNNIIQRNKIYNNTVGLYSLNSVSIIDSNIICGNTDLDVNSSNSYGSSGSNNSCSKLQGWDDSGYIGCTYLCTPTKVISVIDKDRLSVLYNANDVEALMQDLEIYSQRNAGVRYNLTQCRADFDADPTLNDAFSYRNNTNRASWNHYPGFVEGCLARIVSEQANHFNISMANISLLLVGNDNVTPFHRINVRVANWENSYETVSGNIMWSDYPYSDLDNDGDPDIPVSRLIGNAHIMSSTLENARTQYQSNSVLMAGMKSTLDQRDRQIGTEFNTTWCFNNDSIYKYFEETDDIADVRIVNLSFLERLDDGPAIIFLNSHGNDYRDLGEDMHEFSDEWDFEHYKIFLTAQNVADIGLGGGHPFVSSEQCHGGVTYPDDDTSHNMPLAFLSSEAVGYVGSTVYSPFGASDDSGYWFYQSCKDKNSIGRAHLDARQSAWACGSYYKMFAEAWTLYGDPLYEIYVPNDPASNVGYNSSTEIEGENTTLKLSILSYNISKVYTPQGDRDLVTISGAYSTTAYADNKPVIPMIINRIKLPQTRDFKEITGVTKSDVVIMEDVTLPLGCPSRQDENCYGGYSGNTLNLTEVYPNESVEYEILETVDGDRDIFFRIFPLEYNESVNRIYLYQNITFTFETKNATPKLPVQLSLTENYRDEIIAGSPTEIGIFVSNHGEAPAKNLSILEEIPAGFDVSLVSGNGTYYPATNTIVWNIDTISPWDFKMLIYKSVTYNIGDYKINTTIEYIDDYGTVYPPITVSKAIYVGGGNQIFDTGPGTYPSIPGRHNGTITPFYNLSISSIYTYPCPGTGGHTEYAALSYSNGTVIAEARWDGYIEDWHNLTFDKTFTLYANETYRYTIQTGSYPQLHQNATLLLPAGEITCTEFIDANGRIAAPRVPAIKFF